MTSSPNPIPHAFPTGTVRESPGHHSALSEQHFSTMLLGSSPLSRTEEKPVLTRADEAESNGFFLVVQHRSAAERSNVAVGTLHASDP